MNRTRNHNNSGRPARRPFVEDPDKAVFLSGFREDINVGDWRQYREEIYQDINREYGVYITKLDLPVNSKYGYLHVKSIREARKLLNLKPEFSDEEFEGPVMKLAGGIISVFEYRKTQKRINEERHNTRFTNSGYSTREESPVRRRDHRDDRGSRYTSEEHENRYDADRRRERHDRRRVEQEDSRKNETYHRAPASLKVESGDSALPTHDVSETEEECVSRLNRSRSPLNSSLPMNIEQTIVNSPLEPEVATNLTQENEMTIQTASTAMPIIEEPQQQPVIINQLETELSSVVPSSTNSFDDVTTAFNSSDSLAQVLLQQNWHESFNTWPDCHQIHLMVLFMMTFRQEGAHEAVALIQKILTEAKVLELQNQQNLLLALALSTGTPSA